MSTSYGKKLNISIYGGSHAECIGVKATGLPRGFKIDLGELEAFMARRAPGKSPYATQRREADTPIFLSGIDEDGIICDNELHAIIKNTNMRSSDYKNTEFIPRPSHADMAAMLKYGKDVDLRGGGHFSGRLTAPMCIVGGICLQYLKTLGIEIGAHIYAVGGVRDDGFELASVSHTELNTLKERSDFPVLNLDAGEEMKRRIREAAENKDSVGAIIECAAVGLPAGLGEHIFDGMENRIAAIVFGIPAVKGIEFGNGFACADLRGSQNNDAITVRDGKICTKTNNCGGILGGMTNGMPLVFRAAIKPTPSISKEQDSVDMSTLTPAKLTIHGRHDPCIALRAVPVFEAALAIAVCDALLSEESDSNEI